MGSHTHKIQAIEDFDARVVGNVLKGMARFGEYRVLILPDHATPIEVRTHTDEPVPFVLYDSRRREEHIGASFDESILSRDDIVVFDEGHTLMDFFIRGA